LNISHSISSTFNALDPLLFLGLDVATKRDTCALAALSPDDSFDSWYIWGMRIWAPPVNLVTQVEPVLEKIFKSYSVAGLWYDPYQAVTLAQRLASKGLGHRLVEVNQQTQMTQAANTLQSAMMEGRLTLPDMPILRSHFEASAAKRTERGFRIIKLTQVKQIDGVVATAMALLGAATESGQGTHPAWNHKMHVRSPFVFDNEIEGRLVS
jgi:phage terminase large subunit-like protein